MSTSDDLYESRKFNCKVCGKDCHTGDKSYSADKCYLCGCYGFNTKEDKEKHDRRIQFYGKV